MTKHTWRVGGNCEYILKILSNAEREAEPAVVPY
jgi:hypothetical protein